MVAGATTAGVRQDSNCGAPPMGQAGKREGAPIPHALACSPSTQPLPAKPFQLHFLILLGFLSSHCLNLLLEQFWGGPVQPSGPGKL